MERTSTPSKKGKVAQAPRLLNFSRLREILQPHDELIPKRIYFSKEIVVIRGEPKLFQVIMRQAPPFSIDDYRLGIVTRGEVHVNMNLVEKHITAGTIVFIGPGSIITPIRFSPDAEIHGFALSALFPMPFAAGQMPAAFNGQVRDFQLPVGEHDLATALHIVDTIWHIIQQPDYNRQTVSALVAAQMQHYDGLFSRYVTHRESTLTRQETIFDRFVYLVNQHAARQHRLRFYADRMCLTERYLGSMVRQASGTTAKEWIDQAIVARIKVELRHTRKPLGQISEEMNFPNPSFFCKYFKRLTGETPQAFRSA